MALKKAKLYVYGENKTDEIEVMFNPTEYNLSESANYAETVLPGVDGPIMQYVAGNLQTLTLSLQLDTNQRRIMTADHDVKVIPSKSVAPIVRKITDLLYIQGKLHRPPEVRFSWGDLNFYGIVTDVSQSYTMFTSEGTPVRAKLDLTLKSVLDVAARKRRQPLESPDRTKRRTVTAGMQLWNLALEEYGDQEAWRVIAKANGILNPLDIYPGQVLKIPAL